MCKPRCISFFFLKRFAEPKQFNLTKEALPNLRPGLSWCINEAHISLSSKSTSGRMTGLLLTLIILTCQLHFVKSLSNFYELAVIIGAAFASLFIAL